ncbi:MAG: hypothetical protein KC619_12310 [Myxococcales bacterium]|nr:hypothetical protein [Myxococcales bacterium]
MDDHPPELESSAEGLRALRAPGSGASKVGAIRDYWVDFGNAYLDDERDLLRCAVEATVDLVAEHPFTLPWSVDEEDALSRAFAALHARRPVVEAALGRPRTIATGAALVSAVDGLRASSSLTRPRWAWLELAVSIVPIWPEHAGAVIERLAAPSDDGWRSWVSLVALLAYPSAERPLFAEAALPWRRFGSEDGARWNADAVGALDDALEAGIVPGLHRALGFASPDERVAVERVLEDIEQFLWDTDLRRRRAIWMAQLAARTPSGFWPDEYGQAP